VPVRFEAVEQKIMDRIDASLVQVLQGSTHPIAAFIWCYVLISIH
jgi:hypothetical protein